MVAEASENLLRLAQLLKQLLIVGDPTTIRSQQVDVRGGTEDADLKFVLHAAAQGQSNIQGHHSRSDTQDGNERDDRNDRLSSPSQQISEGDKKLKTHGLVRSLVTGHWSIVTGQ